VDLAVELVESEAGVRACHPVLAALRPDYDVEALVAQVARQRLAGYRLAAGRAADGTILVVAGFVVTEKLAWGRHLYVDDLVTAPAARSRGAGAAMLRWLADFARDDGCRALHLDSGVQRTDAHRFYEREGLAAMSLHFATELSPAPAPTDRPAGAPTAAEMLRSRLGADPAPSDAPVDDEPVDWDPSHEGGLDPDFDDL
jgi:GNAT superfamily N-acetyltransferase